MIYISGKITGDPNFREKFQKAEDFIRECYPNQEVINPAKITLPECCGWEDYMDVCLMLLDKADTLYLLEDWQESRGAYVEYGYALAKDMIVLGNTGGAGDE